MIVYLTDNSNIHILIEYWPFCQGKNLAGHHKNIDNRFKALIQSVHMRLICTTQI